MKATISAILMAGTPVPLAGPIEMKDGERLVLRLETPRGFVREYEAAAPYFVFHERAVEQTGSKP